MFATAHDRLPAWVALLTSLALALAPGRAKAGVLGETQIEVIRQALQGQWVTVVGATELILTFDDDDGFAFEEFSGTYAVAGDALDLTADGTTIRYAFELVGEVLTLADGDLLSPMVFHRQPPPPAAVAEVTPAAAPPAAPLPVEPPPLRPESVGAVQLRILRSGLVGLWVADVGKDRLELRVTESGEAVLDGRAGTCRLEGKTLYLQTAGGEQAYQCELVGDVLTLSGGDIVQPLKFARRTEVRTLGGWMRKIFSVSRETVKDKARRILVVCGVVVVSKFVIWLLRSLSAFVVFSNWGFLRHLYREHKGRALTLHSLVLNVCKYFIYFTALGLVMSELGINYTAYIASLSVIGLAVGFGSQGLVQDVVTGFFVIFEAQFDVGDMVEISGQIGRVEELGLRMTRLRNYLGQAVVIPNRNIAVVGNYRIGAMSARVDVAIGSHAAADKAAALLGPFVLELKKQFDGVLMGVPEVSGPLTLHTGETFMRLHLQIWPQQQWVIDQQVMPRVRELLKREGVEVPGDRVVAFYLCDQLQVTVDRFGRRLARIEAPEEGS